MNNIVTVFLIVFLGGINDNFAQSTTQQETLIQYDALAKKIEGGYPNHKIVALKDIKINDNVKEAKSIRNLGMINMYKQYDGTLLKKISTDFSGPQETLWSTYYFDNDQVFLISKTRETYNAPSYSDDFDKSKSKRVNQKYYFENGQLIFSSDRNAMDNDNIAQGLLSDIVIYQQAQNISEDVVLTVQKVTNFENPITDIKSLLSLNEVTLSNEAGDYLRFLFDFEQQKIGQLYPYQIAYLHYDFEEDFIIKINYLDREGKGKTVPFGEEELAVAHIEFELKNKELIKRKFMDIADQDGNIEMNDKGEELILQKYLSINGEILKQEYINSNEYWAFQQLMYRL